MTGGGRLPPAPVVAGVAFLAGSVPFSQIAAKWAVGADLRLVGTGTVSGTSLYAVAGFWPLAAAGILEVAKGAAGVLAAGRARPGLAAAATAAAVSGHNWSPWLGGAGGRGLSPALGALAVAAPEGAAILLGGMAAGRVLRQSALVTLLAAIALVPALYRRGAPGLALAFGVLLPIVAKRLLGNHPPAPDDRRAILRSRLLFDRDER